MRPRKRFSTSPATEEKIFRSKREEGGRHKRVLKNFENVIIGKEKDQIARGEEGLNDVELANTMLLSNLRREGITLPFDGCEFKNALRELIRNCHFSGQTSVAADAETMKKSFRKQHIAEAFFFF